MAYFLLQTNDGKLSQIISGKCLTCARNFAAQSAGPEGPQVWRDSAQSTIRVLRDTDPAGFIFKGEIHDD